MFIQIQVVNMQKKHISVILFRLIQLVLLYHKLNIYLNNLLWRLDNLCFKGYLTLYLKRKLKFFCYKIRSFHHQNENTK